MPEIRKCVGNVCVLALCLCGGTAQAASEPQIFLDGLETPPTLVVYYVSGEGAHGIYRGRRVDGSWQRGEPVLLNGVFDGDAVDPDVLREQDGSFRLYYFRGHFVTPPPPLPEPSRFYSAHSSDGLNFSIDGEVFALDNSTDPSVVRLPDGRRLLAVAQNNAGTMAVRFAISSGDGPFTLLASRIDGAGIPELALLADGSLRLCYNAPGGIASRRSFDAGSSWQPEAGLRLAVAEPIADPSLLRRAEGGWWMFYKAFNGSGTPGPAGHKVNLALALDGDTFLPSSAVFDFASVPDGALLPAP